MYKLKIFFLNTYFNQKTNESDFRQYNVEMEAEVHL